MSVPTSTRTAQKSRRHLATISESQVNAMRECDPDTLASAVLVVRTLSKDSDVTEHATITVASYLPGSESVLHAARAAVAAAKRTVALSRSLGEWADTYGDMTEDVTTAADSMRTASTMARYAPDPATRYGITYADHLATLIGATPALRAPVVAYLSHARTCETCSDAMAQRVTLAGVQAHAAGLDSSHSEFHVMRRAVLTALRATPDRETFHEMIDDPAPMAPAQISHSRVSLGDCAPVSTRVYLAPVRTVTHAVALGYDPSYDTAPAPRVLTEQESTALAHPAPERVARYAGEEYGVDSSPNRRDMRENGTMPSFKPVVSPRKKSGAGSTGPTVRGF